MKTYIKACVGGLAVVFMATSGAIYFKPWEKQIPAHRLDPVPEAVLTTALGTATVCIHSGVFSLEFLNQALKSAQKESPDSNDENKALVNKLVDDINTINDITKSELNFGLQIAASLQDHYKKTPDELKAILLPIADAADGAIKDNLKGITSLADFEKLYEQQQKVCADMMEQFINTAKKYIPDIDNPAANTK